MNRFGVTCLTQVYCRLGRIAWDASCSLPTITEFEKGGKLTVVAWNPGKVPVTEKVVSASTIWEGCRAMERSQINEAGAGSVITSRSAHGWIS